MQIDISGHHVEVTDGIRESIESRFKKIGTHYPDLSKINVVLTVERNSQMVDVQTQYLGAAVAVGSANHDMYVAIADAAKKLDAALKHRKGGIKSGLHDKPELAD